MGAVYPGTQEKQSPGKTNSMGPQDIIVWGLMLVCCMMYSNGEIALKTRKNELPKERRKIVKLLLRNFPLQESASYHNLVEDDEVGQPIHQGNHMTKYAPAFPYEDELESMPRYAMKLPNEGKGLPDLSRFQYALSPILLPPPMSQETVNNNEDDAEVYYAPYMQHNSENNDDKANAYYAAYKQNTLNNEQIISSDPEEEFADEHYIPYMKYDQPDVRSDADDYYHPYDQYSQQQQDEWLQYFQPQPISVLPAAFDKLPELSAGVLYKGPVEEEQLPNIAVGNQFSAPSTIDNEIFDVPKAILKLKH